MNVAILGYGTIGRQVFEFLKRYCGLISACIIYDQDLTKIRGIECKEFSCSIANSISELIAQADFIIESASVSAAKELIQPALAQGKDLLILSVGALIENYEIYFKIAREKKLRLIIPSGAIGGIDVIKACAQAGIEKITLSTYKSILSLANAPYIRENNIALEEIEDERMIFEGNLKEAIRGFPANINVAATLRLASLCENIKICIYASPKLKVNRHEIVINSCLGNYKFICENFPSSENPRTSLLAIYSTFVSLDEYFRGYVKLGC